MGYTVDGALVVGSLVGCSFSLSFRSVWEEIVVKETEDVNLEDYRTAVCI